MKTHDGFDSLVPPVSETHKNGKLTLLDRLKYWPKYEQSREERSSEIDRWRTEVLSGPKFRRFRV